MPVTDTKKYRIMPDLGAEELAALRASIAAYGVRMPVIADDQGELLDGRARLTICQELKLDYPVRIEAGLTETQKRHLVLSLNANRRTLTNRQKRSLIRAELIASPETSDRWLGEILNVDHKTVGAVRAELQKTGEIPRCVKSKAKDGRLIPRKTSVQVASARQVKVAVKALETLGDAAPDRNISTAKISRLARQKRYAEREDRTPSKPLPKSEKKRYRLYHCRFQQLEKTAKLKPSSVDFILADPPYEEAWLPHWEELASFANKHLKEGGILAALAPTMYLPKLFPVLGKYLSYYWTCGFMHDERIKQPVRSVKITSAYRPVLIFTKGKPDIAFNVKDMLPPLHREKELHAWQQPVETIKYYVQSLSPPGALVLDPTLGSGTTAVACKTLGNRSFVGCDADDECVRMTRRRLASVGEEDWAEG